MSVTKKTAPIHVAGLKAGFARMDGTPSTTEVMMKVGQVLATFEEFKKKNDEALTEIRKGREDVVTKNSVETINSEITKLQGELSAMNNKLSAASLAKQAADETPEEVKAYKRAFNRFLRKGEENGLGDLMVKAALTTDSNPDGGYVVVPELDRTITRVLGKVSAIRSISSVQSIGTSVHKKIKNLGGAASGWVTEKASRPETSTPTLSEMAFEAHELYAMPAATQTMLDDGFIDIEGWLASEVAIQFAEKEAAAFITGSGVGQPKGFLSYSFAASTASSPSAWGKIGYTPTGASGDFVASSTSANAFDCLVDLVTSLKPGYRQSARWVGNRATFAKIRKVKDAEGNYIWLPATTAEAPSTLLGYAVTEDDDMPDFGANNYPLAFGDFGRGYLVVDRMGTRVLRDPFSSKPYVLFYTTRRVGGGVQDYHAIKVLKAGNA